MALLRSRNVATASATNAITVTTPAVVAGDMMFFIIAGDGANTITTTTPTGWTVESISLGDHSDIYIYQRVATGTEAGSYSFTANGPAQHLCAQILAFIGPTTFQRKAGNSIPASTLSAPPTAWATAATTANAATDFVLQVLISTSTATQSTPASSAIAASFTPAAGYTDAGLTANGTSLSLDVQYGTSGSTTVASATFTANAATDGQTQTLVYTDTSQTVRPAGVFGTITLGAVSVINGSSNSVTLVGLHGTGSVGAPKFEADYGVTLDGTVQNLVRVGPTGLAAIGYPAGTMPRSTYISAGTIDPIPEGSPAFQPNAFQTDSFQTIAYVHSGAVQATGAVGAVIYQASYFPVFPVFPAPLMTAQGQIGSVSTTVDMNAAVTGVFATGQVGTLGEYQVTYYLDSATTAPSSTYSGAGAYAYPDYAVNDNSRTGSDFFSQGNGKLWVPASLPASMDITFPGARTVDKITVYSPQDTILAVDPDTTITTAYAVKDFLVQTWSGAAWVTQATITSNTKVKRECSFAAVATTKIRVYITAGNAVPLNPSFTTGVAEIEAWGTNNGQYINVAARAGGGLWGIGQVGIPGPDMNVYLDVRGPPYNARLGIIMRGQVGSVSTTRTCTYTIPAGLVGTMALGTVDPTAGYLVTGVTGTGMLGDVSTEVLYRLLGVQATSVLGQFVAGWVQAPTVTGVQGTGVLNPPIVLNHQVFDAGATMSVHGSGGVGQVAFQIDSSPTIAGVVGQGHVGVPLVRVDAPVDTAGVEAAGELGNVTPLGMPSLVTTGFGAVGNVTFVIDCFVHVVGIDATGEVGLAGETRDANAHVTGVQAGGVLGVVAPALRSAYDKSSDIYVRLQ